MLANFHVLAVLEADKELPELDQGFFYNCLRAASEGDRARAPFKDPDFAASVERWKRDCRAPSYRPASSVHAALGAFQNASQEMATSTAVSEM